MAEFKEKIKNPFVRIGIFAVGFLLIHFAIQGFFFNYVKYRSNLRYRLESMFETKVDTLDHLFIGSSHTNKGIAIDSFDHAFKFFGPSETAPYHYYRAKYLLENHDAPIRQIIVPAEIGVLGFNPQPLQYLGIYWKKYIDFRELGSHTDYPFYYAGLGLKIQLFPYHQHLAAMLIMRDMRRDKVVWRYFKEPSWKQYSALEQNIIMNYLINRHFLYGSIVSKVGVDYFEKLTELASEKSAQFVFLKYPLRPEYYNNVARIDSQAIEYEQWTDSLVSATPNAFLIDCEHLYDNHPEFFLDPHHLNEKGKAAFSGWLNDTLNALERKRPLR